MKKKLAVLAVACTLAVIISGFQSSMLYGTDYMHVRPGYTFTVSASVSWWDCNWSYSKKITIDHTKVQDNLTYFPVLLYEASDSNLVAHAQIDGGDIAFVHSNNATQFKHEIEKYDSSTGELWAWVNVSSISSTSDTVFYMYYGNPTGANQWDVTATWDENYIMVQHLNESSDPLLDSTSFNNDGTNDGATYNSSSQIEGGYDFDGNDNITCGNDNSLNITGSITLEGWVKDPPWLKAGSKTYIEIVDKRDEKRLIIPGKEFIVERTISTNNEIQVIFAALFSPGVKIKDMTLDDISIINTVYNSNSPNSDYEMKIEEMRTELPDNLKDLQLIAYSKPFSIDNNNKIKMTFESEKFKSQQDGRISYLVLTSDGVYDFEATTHWTQNIVTMNSIYAISRFKKIIERFLPEELLRKRFQNMYNQLDALYPEKPVKPWDNQHYAKELEVKRTLNSKTFLNEDDVYQKIIGIGPIHYPDENGDLQDIDTRFVFSYDPDYKYEVTKGFYKTKFKKNVNSENLAEYRFNDFVTHIQLLDLSWSNENGEKELISKPQVIEGEIQGNRITYPNAYGPGIDIEFLYHPQYLGKYLIIDSFDSLPLQNLTGSSPYLEFSFKISPSEDLDVYIDGQQWNNQEIVTQGKVEFQDKNTGKTQFSFNKPYSEDSLGNRNLINLSLKKQGPDILVSKRIHRNWLEQAVYPVKADADTIYLDDDMYDMYDNDGSNVDDGTLVYVGRTGGFHFDGYWAFNISEDIITGDIISVNFTGNVTYNDINIDPEIFGLQQEDCPPLEGVADPSGFSLTTNSYNWTALSTGNPTGIVTSGDISNIFNEWVSEYGHGSPPDAFGIVIDDNGASNNKEVYFLDHSHGSYNADTYLIIDYLPTDYDPPTPDPLTWSTPPYNASSSSITMIATTTTDDTPPITYYFNETTGNSGGSDGTWQVSTTYTDDGLSENTQYGYEVKARDNNATPNENNYSTPISYTYTSVDPSTDGELTFNINTTWINATVAQPPNPTTGLTGSNFTWVTGGAVISDWQNGVYYHNRTSLSENTEYGCKVQYRNADGKATTFNNEKTNYTLCDPPTDGEFSIDGYGINWINMSVLDVDNNPTVGITGAYFDCVTGGALDSGWVTDSESGRYYYNSTGLNSGTTYGFKVRYCNGDGEVTTYTGEKQETTLVGYVLPTVQTNETTGIEETNATLNGWLQNNGSVDTMCYLLWGTQNPPTDENGSMGVVANNADFSYDTSGTGALTRGTLYYVDTKANNSEGWDESGSVKTFLTKPDPPSTLMAKSNSSSIIYLTWTTGTGYNTTYIERNASGQTVWGQGEGTIVYNGSGTNCEDSSLTEGVTYYYQAWSFANWSYASTTLYQWSDNNVSANNITNNLPTITDESPANESTGIGVTPQISITVNDIEGDSMTITWYSNSSGLWKIFGTNVTGVDGNGTYYQTNSNFSYYDKTYYWNVSVNDVKETNDSDIFQFTTECLVTSVDEISPYNQVSSPVNITATGDADLDNVTLYYRWSEDNQTWDSWDLLKYDDFEDGFGNYSDGGIDCILYTGGTYAHQGSNAGDIQDNTGDTASFYTTAGIDVDTPGYKCIKVDFWFYAVNMESGEDFFVEYYNGTNWNNVATFVSGTDFSNDQFNHEIVWVNETDDIFSSNMLLKFRCDASASNDDVYIDEVYVNATTQVAGEDGINWTVWGDTYNPDSESPWSWDFNFPNNTGYYEFYSIGNKSGSNDETAPVSADGKCYYSLNPDLSGEDPTNQSTNICPIPDHYVICIDNDTEDTMTAQWWSNSSGPWVQFATNTSISNNTNITQTNTNFSSPGTKYWWSVNLTDEQGHWVNETYSFTTNHEPTLTDEAPTNGTTGVGSMTPALYVITSDQDSDTMTATWRSNSTGPWATFATNTSITTGTNITQTNQNFSSSGTKYWWSVNVTDGCNWTNATYNFTTNYKPVLSNEEPNNGNTSEPLNVMLNITLTDTDGDTMTADWYSNSTGPWVLFATNSSITSGDIINQSNSNFSIENTKYWWSVNVTDGYNWTNATYSFTTLFTGTRPNVTTNASTGVEEINATLWGWLEDNGTLDTECGFWYDTVSGGTTYNYSAGTIAEGDTFSYNAQELIPGLLYYFKAWANNTKEFNGTANEENFLTKPNVTTSLTVQSNSSSIIYLTWTVGDGANTTYIERNQSGAISWDQGDGILVYNGSGINCVDTGLTNSTTYYYQAWSFANWTTPNLFQFSDDNDSGSDTTKNKPEISQVSPANESTGVALNPTPSFQLNHSDGYQMNITWYWGTDNSCPNLFGTNNSVNNGTYEMANSNFTTNSVTYYWKVTINDGHGEWTNETYHFTTVSGNKIMVGKTTSAYSLEINPTGTTLYGYINSNSVSASIDTNWHYVVLTYDGADIKLYKDGEQVDSTGYVGSINKNENNLVLGSWLTGTLDETRVSNTSRTLAWINTTYQNTNSPTTFATFGLQQGVLKTWTYRKKIWLNASLIENDLPYFPVLISTTDTDLQNNALSNGNDIIFTNSSVDWTTSSYTDRLHHEVELYTTATGELVAWVNVTSLSSTTNTSIYMYYGNSLCIINRENPNGVWDSDYVGVWHLNSTFDSTSNSLELTNQGAEANVNGQIDGCYDFEYDEADEMIKTHDDVLNITTQISMEAWIRPEGAQAQYAKIIQKVNDSNDHPYQIDFQGAANDTASVHIFDGVNKYQSWTTTEMNQQVWYYVAGVYDGTNLISYVNGSQESSSNIGGKTFTTTVSDLEIGGNSTITTMGFDGFIDEVRLSKTARNSSWINTSYNNVYDSVSFTEFGSQEIQNIGPIISSPSPSNGAVGQSLNPTLIITVNDTNVDAMNVTFYTNVTGSWGLIGYNDSVYNGTYSQTNDSMNSYGTIYWWSVNATDYTTWTNATYSFTTSVLPVINGENPTNESVGESVWPACNVTVSDTDGGTVDVYFYENTTGVWILQQINSSVDVTSPANVVWGNYSNASQSSIKYNWSVNVSDGIGWTNETYHFTTAASPFLYLYENNKFTKLSDFLPKATSLDKEYTQFIDITGKIDVIDEKVLIKITEELDETTYLDRICLRINNRQIVEPNNIKSLPLLKSLSEQNYLSQINKQLLRSSDNNYLVMKKGDQYLLEFYISKNYHKIEFVSEGYFIKN